MTATITDLPAADACKATATLLLFCPSTTAEPAALANILARAGVKLVLRPHAAVDQVGPAAADVQLLRSRIQECSPTVVLASCPWSLAFCALTAARQAGRPFIYRIDQALGSDEAELDRHATVAQAADLVLLRSADQQAALVACGVAPEKLCLALDAQIQADLVLDFLRLR